MVLHGGIRSQPLRRFHQIVFCQFVLTQSVIGPAKGIEISAVRRLKFDRLFDHNERFVQLRAAIGEHVSEIVKHGSVLRIGGDHLAKCFLSLIVFLLALVGRPAQKLYVFFVLIPRGKLSSLVQSRLRLGPAFQPCVHLGQVNVDVAIVSVSLEQGLHLIESSIHLPHVSELRGINHLQAAIIGQFLSCLLGNVSRLLPLLAFPISVDNLLVPTFGVVVAQRQHLLECLYGKLIVVVVAVDRSQALKKHRPVVFFALAVAIVGFVGFLDQVLQNLRRFVVAPLRLVNGGDVVRHFHRVLHHGLGLLQVVQREIELAVPAVNLGHAQVGLRVLGIRVGNDFVLLERSVRLTVVQQILR